MSMRALKISSTITNREAQSLDKYLQEISKIKLLSPREEEQLSILVKNGDRAAKDTLTRSNLRFVVSVAKQYQGRGLSLPDLINEGNVGLINAAGKFDSTRGFKFISFAVWWIRQSMLQALAEKSRTIRLPTNKILLKNKVYKAQSELEQELGRSPSTDEVADVLDIDVKEITDSLLQNNPVSLDSPFIPGEEGSLLDTLENPNVGKTERQIYFSESLSFDIDRSLQVLTDRQKETICYFFGIGVEYSMTLEDIGQKFNLTTERVRQIRDKAIDKLRTTASRDLLRPYL